MKQLCLICCLAPGLAIRVFLLYGRSDKVGETSTFISGSTLNQNSSTSSESQLVSVSSIATAKAVLPELMSSALQDSTDVDTRETDWGSLVIGPRASNVSSDFQDPALFKLYV